MLRTNPLQLRFPTDAQALLAAFAVLLIARPAFGAEPYQPDWWAMGIGLFGGLAMFLYGMDQLTAGLKAAAGERMKAVAAARSTGARDADRAPEVPR